MDNHPNNFYIGDYAVFLHRRKRDFNNAEKYDIILIFILL